RAGGGGAGRVPGGTRHGAGLGAGNGQRQPPPQGQPAEHQVSTGGAPVRGLASLTALTPNTSRMLSGVSTASGGPHSHTRPQLSSNMRVAQRAAMLRSWSTITTAKPWPARRRTRSRVNCWWARSKRSEEHTSELQSRENLV